MSRVLEHVSGVLATSDRPLRVIEIGTSYGRSLHLVASRMLSAWIAVDPMYHWVPDVAPDNPFDPSLVNPEKVDEWRRNSMILSPAEVSLLIGRSWDVARDPAHAATLSGADVLIVDGCHHPSEAVEADYRDFVPHLAAEHLVIFDDVHQSPGEAYKRVLAQLESEGRIVDSGTFQETVAWIRVRLSQ